MSVDENNMLWVLLSICFHSYCFFVDVKESLVGVGLVSYDNKFKIAQLEKGIVDAFQPWS